MAEDLKARLEEEIGALCAKCAAFSRDESACDECPLPKLLEALDALSQLLSSLLEPRLQVLCHAIVVTILR